MCVCVTVCVILCDNDGNVLGGQKSVMKKDRGLFGKFGVFTLRTGERKAQGRQVCGGSDFGSW